MRVDQHDGRTGASEDLAARIVVILRQHGHTLEDISRVHGA